jgi:antitoxin component of RelBE/YafQ-DinJ toxin-antitoxin module
MKTTTKKSVKVPTTIRLDAETKEWAQSFARRSGIDLSALITLSLLETKQKRKLVIEDPWPLMTPEKRAYYEDIIAQDDAGTLKTKRYESLEAMKKDLLKA